MMKTKTNANGGLARKIRDTIAAIILRRIAGALCRATLASDAAGDEILYGLPGVFSMEIRAERSSIRLIKEARSLRVMKKSEKSDILLTIKLEDLAVAGDITGRECSMQKALAEGRLTFAGKTKHFAAIIRASAAGDKTILPNEEYYELYGKNKED